MTDRMRCGSLVFVVVAIVWGLITHGTFAGSGDEPHYAMIAHSLAFDADLDLANNYRDATLIGGGTLAPESHAIQHEKGLRPVHDIGMPLAFAPFVRVAYSTADRVGGVLPTALLETARLNKALLFRHQLSLAMAFLTGLLAREMFLSIRGLGGGHGSAFVWALLFAVTPPIVSHSFLFFTEIPSALITLFVFRRVSLQPISTPVMAAFVGSLTGFLLLVHVRNVGVVAGLTLLTILMVRRRALRAKPFAAFLVAVAVGVLIRSLTTYVLWGALVTTPHAAVGATASAGETLGEIFVRATGLLFDREHGLIAYAPVYLLAGPGLLVLWRQREHLSRDLLLVMACYLIPVLLPLTNVHGWRGGWSPAARFLVPVAPLLWLAVYRYGTDAAKGARLLVAGLIALQLGINAYVWQFPKTLWNDGDGLSAFRFTQWLPTWSTGEPTVAFAVALSASVALAYLGYLHSVHSSSGRPGGFRKPEGPRPSIAD